MIPSDTKPAAVDPAKLRRTAWILVGVMVIGGFLILKSYQKMTVEQAEDNRPAMIHQIRKERDLTIIRQDGKTAPLFDLRGKVVAIHCISLENPERTRRTMEIMKRLAASQNEIPNLQLITLAIDPPAAEETVKILQQSAESLGIALPHWWLATTEEKTLHKFIRNELKTTIPPHKTAEGWQFETSVFLMDRQGRLRRAVIPQQRGGPPFIATFDFDQAADWDTKGVKTGTDRTNEQQLEKLLRETIGHLLAESATPS